ncbi:MAG: hypothetical protein U0836_01120 [Pirellulales bacterium]
MPPLAELAADRAARNSRSLADVRGVGPVSGRNVSLRLGPDGEEFEIRSPAGELELRILLTPEGPVLRLEAARIEVQAAEKFRVDCGEFHVAAERGLHLQADETVQIEADRMRVRTQDDIRLNGSFVRLNCPE